MRIVARLASLRLTVGLLAAGALYAALTGFTPLTFAMWPFFVIIGAFQVNLGACTIRRVLRRPHRAVRDWMPDLIHIGLLVLVAGAGVSAYGRSEQAVALSAGDTFRLGDRWELELSETRREADNWVSAFVIADATEGSERRGATRVNAPLAVGPYRLYQTGWDESPVVALEYEDGRTYTMAAGEGFQTGEELFLFERGSGDSFDLVWTRDGQEIGRLDVEIGQEIGGLIVVGVERIARTVVTIVRDPGAGIALAGGLIMALAMGGWAIIKGRGATT